MSSVDTHTRHEAERLARTIERFWRNGAVRVWAEPDYLGHWVVKSNLVNGLPPRAITRRAAA